MNKIYIFVYILLLFPAVAVATSCGDTLTTSTTLTNNLSCSGNVTALHITANNVILDCNDYNITGNKSKNSVGINISNINNITIKNCNIYNFDKGIEQDYTTNNTIYNNYIFSNFSGGGIGIDNNFVTNNNYTNNTVFSNSSAGVYSVIESYSKYYYNMFESKRSYGFNDVIGDNLVLIGNKFISEEQQAFITYGSTIESINNSNFTSRDSNALYSNWFFGFIGAIYSLNNNRFNSSGDIAINILLTDKLNFVDNFIYSKADDCVYLYNSLNSTFLRNNLTCTNFSYPADTKGFNIASGGGGTNGSRYVNLTNNIVNMTFLIYTDGIFIDTLSDYAYVKGNKAYAGRSFVIKSDNGTYLDNYGNGTQNTLPNCLINGGDYNTIINQTCEGISYTALRLYNANNNLINNSVFHGDANAIRLYGSSRNNITNSEFTAGNSSGLTWTSIYIESGGVSGDNYLINCTYDSTASKDIKSDQAGNTTNITLMNFVEVNVSNSTSPLENVNISVTDIFSGSVFDGITGSDGHTPIFQATYLWDGSDDYIGATYYDNHSIEAFSTTIHNKSLTQVWNVTTKYLYNIITSLISVDIDLISPSNNTWNSSQTINFTFNITFGYPMTNCSLWTNESGWSLKQTNSSAITNKTINGISETFSSDGHYLWNIECYTTKSGNYVSQNNYTIKVDFSPPIWYNNKTTLTTSTSSGTNVSFNITINDSNPDKYIFSWYEGSWANNSPRSYTSGTEIEETKITTTGSGTVMWRWFFNDTLGNSNSSDEFSITFPSIAGGEESTIPFFNEKNMTISEKIKKAKEKISNLYERWKDLPLIRKMLIIAIIICVLVLLVILIIQARVYLLLGSKKEDNDDPFS